MQLWRGAGTRWLGRMLRCRKWRVFSCCVAAYRVLALLPRALRLGWLERDGLPGGLSGRVKARAWGWRGSPSVAAPCAAFLRCHMGDRLILQSGVAGNLYQIRTIRPTGAP